MTHSELTGKTRAEPSDRADLDEQSAKIEEHNRLAAVILDGTCHFVALLDINGNILAVNRAALDGAGHRIQEIRGTPFWTARWWQVSQELQRDLQAAIRRAAAGQLVRYEADIYCETSGDPTPVDFSLQPIRGESGEMEYLLAEARSLTERKLDEEKLARQAQELRILNDRLTELARAKTQMVEEELRILQRVGATISAELDLKKLLQAVTDAGRELSEAEFGAFFYNMVDSEGEKYQVYILSGAPLEAFEKFGMPSNTSLFGPTFRGEGTIRIDDVYEDPRYGKNAPYYGMPPGHLPVHSYLAVPVVSRSSEVLGGLFYGHSRTGVFTERSERLIEGLAAQAAIGIDNAHLYQRAQQEIEQRKGAEQASALLAAIVQSSEDAIISKDFNAVITSWNRAAERIFGYSEAEAVGQPITMLMPPDRLNEEPAILEKIRSGQRVEHYETVRRHKNGALLDISLTISPVYNREGQIIGASKIARDISDRKRIEATLLKAHGLAAAGRMSASIAHEINNPLEAVTNLLYLMRSDVTGETAAKNLATAEAELARVARITKKTLAYYRDSSKPETVDLNELINDTLSVFARKIKDKQIEVVRTGQPGSVHGFKGELQQLFSNLTANAVDAVDRGGRIEIAIDGSGAVTVVTVRDNGMGIPPDHKAKLFEPFFTTKEQHMGTGLGLWISKEIAQKHGAEIAVESSTDLPDRGTTFTVKFPEAPTAQRLSHSAVRP